MVVYIVFVMISLIIGSSIKRKSMRVYMLFLAIGLAIIAYNIDVHPTSDLVNHYNKIELFRDNQISLQDSFAKLNIGTSLYLWVFSFFSNNAFLQSFSVFFCYILMFGLIHSVCKDNDAPKSIYMLCIAMTLMAYNFFLMANSIRIWLAFSAFFYLLYNDIVRRKNKILIWLGYIAIVLFHYGSLMLVVGRIVVYVYDGLKRRRILNWIMLGICVLGLIAFLSSPYFSTHIIPKIQGYAMYSVRGTWQTIVGFVRVTMVLILSLCSFKRTESKYREYLLVVLFICFIPLLMFTNYTIILRFGDAVIATSSVAIVLSNKISGYSGFSINRMSLLNVFAIMCMIFSFVAFLVFDYRYLGLNLI